MPQETLPQFRTTRLYLLIWDGGQEYVAANSIREAMRLYPNLSYTSVQAVGNRVLVLNDIHENKP